MRLLIAFLSSAASLLAGLAFTTLTVTRYTIVDEDTYLYEEGELTVDGPSGFLANPNFTLYQGTTPLLVNDNWCDTRPAVIVDAATRVGAFPYTANSKDAAMVVILAPGPYTVTITGDAGTSGGSAPPGLRGAWRKRRLPVLARRPATHTATGRNSVFTYAFKSPRP